MQHLLLELFYPYLDVKLQDINPFMGYFELETLFDNLDETHCVFIVPLFRKAST